MKNTAVSGRVFIGYAEQDVLRPEAGITSLVSHAAIQAADMPPAKLMIGSLQQSRS